MERRRIEELHYITHHSNLPSILERGILSYKRVQAIQHTSVADGEVQGRRARKIVPNRRPLHDYVPLYFHARNVMMYVLNAKGELAVLRINPRVLDVPDVVIADRNAATGAAAFYPTAEGIDVLDERAVYARNWAASIDERQKRCAEVLVPDRVDPSFILGAWVVDEDAADLCHNLNIELNVMVGSDIFFRN